MLTSENDPDRGTSDYRYNSFGELMKYKQASGDSAFIIYDCMGRDSIRIRNSVNTYYTYYTSGSGKGRVSQVYSQNNYKKFIYDVYGNVTRECDSISATESFPYNYRYDNYGRLSWQMYPGGFAITYHYNNKGYLEYIRRASDNSAIWQCNAVDAEGNITQYKLAAVGNITVDKSFDEYGYLNEIKTTSTSVRQWFTYSFDQKTGDLKQRRDNLRSLTEEFGYDGFDQLKYSKATGLDSLKMDYDVLGNITYKSDVGEYRYNDQRVHAVDSIIGSQNLNRQNIEYNNFNKPLFIANDNDSLVYQYNIEDDRIKAFLYDSIGLSRTTWYAGAYEKALVGDSTFHFNYINGPDGPVALVKQSSAGTVIYYICKDHLGSITGIMNSSGELLEEYNYDPWGKRRNPADWSYTSVATPTLTQHGFTGHEHLDMFNLINMNGRIYDSEIARFLNPDPIIQDPYNLLNYNRYTYCLNNPLKFIDPSGYSYERFKEIYMHDREGSGSGAQFFNNYVGWWQNLQNSYSVGAYQYYISSGFRDQFPNATFNNVREGNLLIEGNPSGQWSPTQGRTSAVYSATTITLEGKFTYHCPGEVEMSSYYIPIINLNSGFWDPSLETKELDNTLTAGGLMFSAGEGISKYQIRSSIKALVKSGKSSLPYFSKGGKFLGYVSIGINAVDFAYKPTWGNAVKVGLDIGSMAPYGWIYGIIDLSFAAFSNASLTDRIGVGIDSFLSKNGGVMIPVSNGYVWISNYKKK